MALPVRDQIKYWGIAAIAVFVVLWFLGDVMLPFVLGAAVAYFLDPVADRLERLGLSRAVAVAVIAAVAVLVLVIVALLIIPSIVAQAIALFDTAPQLARDL
ncbi:MAG TPA: AI-2E family transporter, partial [Roseovarius sp.]|nr:AI-2E family transporter [Roseovarius sp.]